MTYWLMWWHIDWCDDILIDVMTYWLMWWHIDWCDDILIDVITYWSVVWERWCGRLIGHGLWLWVPRKLHHGYLVEFVCVCVCACMRACVHACMRVCVYNIYICIYIYIYIYNCSTSIVPWKFKHRGATSKIIWCIHKWGQVKVIIGAWNCQKQRFQINMFNCFYKRWLQFQKV